MKVFTFILLFMSTYMIGQNQLSANLDLGLGFPFTDISGKNHIGKRENFILSSGLSYSFSEYSSIRGDILFGYLNDANNLYYWESSIYDGSLSYEIDLLHFLNKKSKTKINLRVGSGIGLLNGKRFDINTRHVITEIPLPQRSNTRNSYSMYTFGIFGGTISIPINEDFTSNFNYTYRFLNNYPWLDSYDKTQSDNFSIISIGLCLHINHNKTNLKYKKINLDTILRLERNYIELSDSLIELTINNEYNNHRIDSMKYIIDSLSIPISIIDSDSINFINGFMNLSLTDSSYKKLMRVVVYSTTSKEAALRFIKRTTLDTENMFIVYINRLMIYSIVYKSTNTIEEAKKHLRVAKQQYKKSKIYQF